jgi:hypothetical protein
MAYMQQILDIYEWIINNTNISCGFILGGVI